jgi:hypothetical protein
MSSKRFGTHPHRAAQITKLGRSTDDVDASYSKVTPKHGTADVGQELINTNQEGTV